MLKRYKKFNNVLIKADIEGAELDLVGGLKKILEHRKNVIFLSEFNPFCLDRAGVKSEDFIKAIKSTGLDFFIIDGNKDDLRKSHPQNWHRNIVGVSKSFQVWSKKCFGKEQRM